MFLGLMLRCLVASNLVAQKGLSSDKQVKVDAILKKYEEQNRLIELEHLKSKGLIGLMDSEYAFTTNYNNKTDRFYDHLINVYLIPSFAKN